METGLYYLKTRYYDPETGRFISPDGIEYIDAETINGLNLYTYCGNNPVMRVDPNGNAWWDWIFAGLVIVACIAGAVFTGGATFFGAALISSALWGASTLGAVSIISQAVK